MVICMSAHTFCGMCIRRGSPLYMASIEAKHVLTHYSMNKSEFEFTSLSIQQYGEHSVE